MNEGLPNWYHQHRLTTEFRARVKTPVYLCHWDVLWVSQTQSAGKWILKHYLRSVLRVSSIVGNAPSIHPYSHQTSESHLWSTLSHHKYNLSLNTVNSKLENIQLGSNWYFSNQTKSNKIHNSCINKILQNFDLKKKEWRVFPSGWKNKIFWSGCPGDPCSKTKTKQNPKNWHYFC